ncbi:13585_t:CDS:2, partial [Funneliformis caledonium]
DLSDDKCSDNEPTSNDINNENYDDKMFATPERFRLSDVTINSLIGFFSLVLKHVDSHQFKEFPSTAYMAKKLLDIKKESKTFTVYPDCNKLYDTISIIPSNLNDNENLGLKYIYIEFPNHLIQNYRNPMCVRITYKDSNK